MTEHTDIEGAVASFMEEAATTIREQQNAINSLREEIGSAVNQRPGRGRQTEPDPLGNDDADRPRRGPRAQVLGPAGRDHGLHGFGSAGEFLHAVRLAGSRTAEVDQRLYAASATTFGNENSGDAGGS